MRQKVCLESEWNFWLIEVVWIIWVEPSRKLESSLKFFISLYPENVFIIQNRYQNFDFNPKMAHLDVKPLDSSKMAYIGK